MNIIFLDIDGVITTHRVLLAQDTNREDKSFDNAWDFIAIGALNKWCSEFNAKIVISSTWRMRGPLCIEQLTRMGLNPDHIFKEEPFTPVMGTGTRADEITRWLMKRWHKMRNFIVLDDDDDGLSAQFGERFIKTDTYNGLTFDAMRKATTILAKYLTNVTREP